MPHVGAIAALALQAAPCLLDGGRGALDPVAARLALRDLIVDTAVALNDSGVPDNVSGSGRVDAIAAIQGTLPVFTGATTLVVDANSESGAILTAAQLGFADAASVRPDAAGVDRRLRHQSRRRAHLPARDEHGQRLGQPQRRQLLGAGRPAHHRPLTLKSEL